MTYAQILCVLSGAHDDSATLLAAAELAKTEGAVVKVVPSLPLTDAVIWGDAFGTPFIAASALEAINEGHMQMRLDMARLARRTAEALCLSEDPHAAPAIVLLREQSVAASAGPAGGLGDVASLDRDPSWRILNREGPLADLAVVGEAAVQADGFWAGSAGQALMSLRTPTLVVRAPETAEGGVVAIAWDGSLAAGRAVRGALPVLKSAKRIVVLQDPDGMTFEEKASGDPARLIDYLALRQIRVADVRRLSGWRDGKSLLAAAEAEGAAVLVAGAFGHTQFREFLFGGVTRALSKGETGPHLLLAH